QRVGGPLRRGSPCAAGRSRTSSKRRLRSTWSFPVVVAADDGAEPVEFGSFAVMTQGWGEVVFDEVLQLRGVLPDLGDVPVGVGDVLAGGSAVVLVGSAADVVLGGPELAQRFGRVEHAGHGAAGRLRCSPCASWRWFSARVSRRKGQSS